MRFFCITSNVRRHLIHGFAELFNHLWPVDQKVTVLGYLSPGPLPSNFDFVSLGSDNGLWCDGLIPYIENLDVGEKEPLAIVTEDFFLVQPPDFKIFTEGVHLIEEGIASKVILTSLPKPREPFHHELFDTYPQTEGSRPTLHPSLWTKSYFKSFLVPGYTAWDFEVKNASVAKNDGHVIVQPKINLCGFPFFNTFVKGGFNHREWIRACKSDWRYGPLPWQEILSAKSKEVLLRYAEG